MFFTKWKLSKRIEEMGRKRYFGEAAIAPFNAMDGQLSTDEHYTEKPEKIEGKTFDIGDMFIGRDKYLWLEKEVEVPLCKEGCEVIGLFDFGITGGGTNSGFESLLYVNDEKYQGVDSNHKEVFFEGFEGEKIKLTFMLWTGLEGGGQPREMHHRCNKAHFVYLHKKADELYYFARAILGTLDLLEEDSEYYESLLGALDRAMVLLDWDGENFYETVDAAHSSLMKDLSKIEKHTSVTVNVVGHTHIDVAWLWRLKHTREKVQRSFATVLRLMERYDEYIFLQTQPQLYKYIKEDCPEMFEKIKQRVAEGKWETDGGMWVEADCNLSSGESLVRQFLHGTRFFEREFGTKCEYLWLPDVFGYSWALPQILKLCEIDTFMTTKISWNQYNNIPDDLFRWRGIDGTEILTYFVNTPGERQSYKDKFSTYNGMMVPNCVIGNWKKFKNKELSNETLLCYGHGDGGGGVNREMLEMRRVMDKLPGIPNVKTARAGDFFKKIHSRVDNTDRYVHIWDGELYLEYHRGTYTTQCYNKKMNRYLENKIAQAEWLSSLSYVLGGEYAQADLNDAWECVLLHQFHDIIPGSSINEVYKDSHLNYEKAEKQTDRAKEVALGKLLKEKENVYSVYSTNSFGGNELVLIPETKKGYFTDNGGNVLKSQKNDNGYEVLVDVKPFSAVEITFNEGNVTQKNSAFTYENNSIDTPFYKIEWNNGGRLTRIFDKEACREVLKNGQEGNVLEVFEDKPLEYDAWNVDIFYDEKMTKINLCEVPQLIECGNLKAVIRFKYGYNKSAFTQDMVVYADSRRIDFKTNADWFEKNKLLKVAFYTDIRSTKATYDIQFGHVERPTHWNTSWDMAKFEVCAHKWADLAENGYGVSLLNNCKYGYSIKDNAIKLSLLRAPKYPDYEADMGRHEFTYSLYPHLLSVTDGGTIEEANRLNLPAVSVKGEFAVKGSLVKLDNSNVQIDVVKKAEDEDCLIVRMHECRGGRCVANLSSDCRIKQIIPCNLLEHNTGEAVAGSAAELIFRPFEIKTLKLYF